MKNKSLIIEYESETDMLVDIKETVTRHHDLLAGLEENSEYRNSSLCTAAVRAIVLLDGFIERSKSSK